MYRSNWKSPYYENRGVMIRTQQNGNSQYQERRSVRTRIRQFEDERISLHKSSRKPLQGSQQQPQKQQPKVHKDIDVGPSLARLQARRKLLEKEATETAQQQPEDRRRTPLQQEPSIEALLVTNDNRTYSSDRPSAINMEALRSFFEKEGAAHHDERYTPRQEASIETLLVPNHNRTESLEVPSNTILGQVDNDMDNSRTLIVQHTLEEKRRSNFVASAANVVITKGHPSTPLQDHPTDVTSVTRSSLTTKTSWANNTSRDDSDASPLLPSPSLLPRSKKGVAGPLRKGYGLLFELVTKPTRRKQEPWLRTSHALTANQSSRNAGMEMVFYVPTDTTLSMEGLAVPKSRRS